MRHPPYPLDKNVPNGHRGAVKEWHFPVVNYYGSAPIISNNLLWDVWYYASVKWGAKLTKCSGHIYVEEFISYEDSLSKMEELVIKFIGKKFPDGFSLLKKCDCLGCININHYQFIRSDSPELK